MSLQSTTINEEKSLPELYNWIIEVMQANKYSYEIIFIDDLPKSGVGKVLKADLTERLEPIT